MLAEINKLLFEFAPIFYDIVYMSLIATIVGIVILIIKKIFGTRLSPKIYNILWLVFIVLLFVPIKIESSFSIYNVIPINVSNISNVNYRDEYDEIKYVDKLAIQDALKEEETNIDYSKYVNIDGKVDTQKISNEKNSIYIRSVIFDCILPFVYLLAVTFLTIFTIVSYYIFSYKIGKKSITNERILQIFEDCKGQLNIKKDIAVINQNLVYVPSLFEIFKTKILVSDNIYNLDDEQIRYIFLHELSHYKRKDLIKNMVLTILSIVHWFNPIVHLCIKNIRKDMELEVDNMVTKKLSKEQQKNYCKTLVELSSKENTGFASRVLCISNNKKELEGRIKMIKNVEWFSKHKIFIGIIGVILLVFLIVCFATTKLTLEPPNLYATTDNSQYVKLIRNGYNWSSGNTNILADSIHPLDANYTDYETMNVNLGENIRLTNARNSSNIGGNIFYPSDIRYYDMSGKQIIMTGDKFPVTMGTKEAYIETPSQVGTYILEVIIDYYDKGNASYSMKVNVGYDFQGFEEYKGTYIGDNSKVRAIVDMIQYSKYVEQIELKTNNEPYGLKIKYNVLQLEKEDLEFNSIVLFSLIQNLDYIDYVFISDKDYTVTVQRNEYSSNVNLTYDGLVSYLNNTQSRKMLEEITDKYLPAFTYIYQYLDYEEDMDTYMLQAILAIYYSNENAQRYDGLYPREMVNKVHKEITGYELKENIQSLGTFPYIEESDCFEIFTEIYTPTITRVNNFEILENGNILIEYEYCYAGEDVILNLPMIEVGEDAFEIEKQAYKDYIDSLTKYNSKIELKENKEYEYSKYMIVSYEKI